MKKIILSIAVIILLITAIVIAKSAKHNETTSVTSDAKVNSEGKVRLLYDTLLKQNAKKVDIVVVNATSPISMMDYFGAITEKEKGLTIGTAYSVNADEKDFRGLIAKLKNSNPDYVIVMLTAPAIDIFLKQYRKAGITIPFTGIETFTFLQNKQLAEGMWYVDAAPAASGTDGSPVLKKVKNGKIANY